MDSDHLGFIYSIVLRQHSILIEILEVYAGIFGSFKIYFIGSRIYRLAQKTFSQFYKRCGQISQFFIGGRTKTEKFLINVGKFQIFLIFTTATNTGKRKGQEMEPSTCMPPTMMSGRF